MIKHLLSFDEWINTVDEEMVTTENIPPVEMPIKKSVVRRKPESLKDDLEKENASS